MDQSCKKITYLVIKFVVVRVEGVWELEALQCLDIRKAAGGNIRRFAVLELGLVKQNVMGQQPPKIVRAFDKSTRVLFAVIWSVFHRLFIIFERYLLVELTVIFINDNMLVEPRHRRHVHGFVCAEEIETVKLAEFVGYFCPYFERKCIESISFGYFIGMKFIFFLAGRID